MGRGGPPEPEVDHACRRPSRHSSSSHDPGGMRRPITSRLLRSSGWRRSAAGAVAAGWPERSATSNVAEGARVAASLDPDLVVFDGSGAAFPPIARRPHRPRRRRAPGSATSWPAISTRTGSCSPTSSSLTMAEPGTEWERIQERVRACVRPGVPVVATTLRPSARSPPSAAAASRTSARPLTRSHASADHLENDYGARRRPRVRQPR